MTIFDLLPGAPEVQRRKLEILAQLRKLTHDPALVVLNDKEKADLAKIDPSPALARADTHGPAGDRPAPVHRGRRLGRQGGAGLPARRAASRSGTGAICSVSPRCCRTIKLDNGKVIETSGFAVVFGSMIRSVLHDGPIATVASLVAVMIIICFTIRPAAAALMALTTLISWRPADDGRRGPGAECA